MFAVHYPPRGRLLRQLQDDQHSAVEEERAGKDRLQRLRPILQVQRGECLSFANSEIGGGDRFDLRFDPITCPSLHCFKVGVHPP